MARLPLRAFLFASLTIGTMCPLAYLGPTQIAHWRQVQRQDADKELLFSDDVLARAIVQAVDADLRALETTAGEVGTPGSLNHEFLTAALQIHRERFHGCDAATVIDPEGRVIAADPNQLVGMQYGDRVFFQETKKTNQTAISEVQIGKALRNLSIHVGTPIRATLGPERGKTIGYLGASVGLDHLRTLALRVVDAFGDVQARVLDRHLRVIVDSDVADASALTDLSDVAMYKEAPFASIGLKNGRDEHQRGVRAAVTRIPERGLGWTVAVTRPLAKIEEQARRALLSTFVAISGALVLGLIMAFALSTWLSGPIRKLALYTVRVGSGSAIPQPTPAHWDAREVATLFEKVGAMADAMRAREAEQVVLARFKKEMEIAQRIQSGILPKHRDIPGFDIAAVMKPADEVSGDYYEMIPTGTGCWIALGDVSGHGLNAGLVMLMLQSALGALVISNPSAGPFELLRDANELLFENIRNRLEGDDYATLVLMHLDVDGRFAFAGAHEPIIIVRQTTGRCELVETTGVWMGVGPIDAESMPESRGNLMPGDMIVLYSDGIVERGASTRNPFGIERLCATVERLRDRAVQVICQEVLREAQTWIDTAADDDMTVLVLRYLGPETMRSAS